MCSLYPEKVDVSFFDATMRKHLSFAKDRKHQLMREISLRALGSLTLIRFSFDKKFKDIFDITLGFGDFDKRFSPYFDKFIDVQLYFLEMLSSSQWKSEGKLQSAIIHYLGVLLRLMDLCEFITDGKIYGPFWSANFLDNNYRTIQNGDATSTVVSFDGYIQARDNIRANTVHEMDVLQVRLNLCTIIFNHLLLFNFQKRRLFLPPDVRDHIDSCRALLQESNVAVHIDVRRIFYKFTKARELLLELKADFEQKSGVRCTNSEHLQEMFTVPFRAESLGRAEICEAHDGKSFELLVDEFVTLSTADVIIGVKNIV